MTNYVDVKGNSPDNEMASVCCVLTSAVIAPSGFSFACKVEAGFFGFNRFDVSVRFFGALAFAGNRLHLFLPQQSISHPLFLAMT